MKVLTNEIFKKEIFDYEKNEEWKYMGDKPCVIDSYASWCQPCKVVAPIFEELSKEYGDKINFYKFDTEENPELSELFEIRSIPTFIFIPVGGNPQKAMGAIPKQAFQKIFKENLNIE